MGRFFLNIMMLFVLLTASSAQAETAVTGVRIGDHAQSTRFVLDLTGPAEYHLFMLPDPYRVVVDFSAVKWNIPPAPKGESSGLINAYRFGQYQPGTSRLVLDVSGPVKVTKAFLLQPSGDYGHRFVIDIATTDRASFMAARGKPQARPTRVTPTIPMKQAGKRTVVIDPGHGGVDPGTISASGKYEKDITLRAGHALKKELEKTGRYNVHLTRDKDFYIPLRQRVEIGRKAEGDLFISLHADSIKNNKIRGATVYTLSESSSDKEAAALARKENKSDIIAGVDLEGESPLLAEILIDLMQRETMNYSAEFAEVLIPEMGKQVQLRTNSHRFAGFRVLKAPDVPSVLVEMGYLSNSQDTKFLASDKGLKKIAIAITKAVDRYFAQRDALLATQ